MSNIADLRKLSARLRRTGSEVLNAPIELVPARLRRLMLLVEEESVFRAAVDAAPAPEEDPLELLEAARNAGARLSVPISDLEHLGFLHALLTQLADEEVLEEATPDGEFWRLCFHYGYVMDMKECVSEVLDDTVRPYVGYLERVVSDKLIDATEAAEQPRSVSLSIQGSPNTMVNVAGNASSIQAQQQQEIAKESSEVLDRANQLVKLLAEDLDISTETQDELRSLAGEAVAQVGKDEPDTSTLNRLTAKLRGYTKKVEGATELALAVRGLALAVAKFGAVVSFGHHLLA